MIDTEDHKDDGTGELQSARVKHDESNSDLCMSYIIQ
jgi:hypothetical protein